MHSLVSFKEVFDPELQQWVEGKIKNVEKLTVDDPFILFFEHIRRLLLNGGKRARPYLAYCAYSAFGGKDERSLHILGIALEIFHTFGLIHDDIIDHGRERHGVSTLHVFVSAELEKMKRHGDLPHIGNAQAILLGDLLFSWVFDLLSTGPWSPSEFQKLWSVFRKMTEAVLVGQMIDVDLTTRGPAPYALIEKKMLLKTASYTFIYPLVLGATLAGASEASMKHLEELGRELGLAFQIQDDLFDVTASSGQMKKSILSDIREGQQTFLTRHIFEHGSLAAQAELASYLGKEISLVDQSKVVELFTRSGALEAARVDIEHHMKKAEEYVLHFDWPTEEGKEVFLHLIQFLSNRKT